MWRAKSTTATFLGISIMDYSSSLVNRCRATSCMCDLVNWSASRTFALCSIWIVICFLIHHFNGVPISSYWDEQKYRAGNPDKDRDQVVRKLVVEVAELRSEVTKLKTSQARRQHYKPSKIKHSECSVSFEFWFLLEMWGIGLRRNKKCWEVVTFCDGNCCQFLCWLLQKSVPDRQHLDW